MVVRALEGRHPGGGTLLDVGCGRGQLWPFVQQRFDRYFGADVVQYEGFPAEGMFHKVDLDTGRVPLPDGVADVVAAVETIEHLENPRAFFRELVRLARPGGWVLVTTPNQLSWLSKLTLLVKNQFNAFQEGDYPAHLTALLEIDLRRMAAESALGNVLVKYTRRGRLILTPWHYPATLCRFFPRGMSDNVMLIGRVLTRDSCDGKG
jgi:2-polyprenyl-3-methyl-5-hydroxy-6-metoxy-1,4-benzoquinol methylase